MGRSSQPFSFFLACSSLNHMQDSHCWHSATQGTHIAQTHDRTDEFVPFEYLDRSAMVLMACGHFALASQSAASPRRSLCDQLIAPNNLGSSTSPSTRCRRASQSTGCFWKCAKRSHHRFSVILSTARLERRRPFELFTEEEAGSPQVESGVLDDAIHQAGSTSSNQEVDRRGRYTGGAVALLSLPGRLG